MNALFDMYKVDLSGSAMWLGSIQSYGVALFEIKLTAAKAPGDYAIGYIPSRANQGPKARI